MRVNLKQYRETVGVFNNRNLATRKSYDLFSSRLLQQPLLKIYSTKTLLFLLMIAIRFVIYIINAQHVRLIHRSLFKSLYFITIAFYIHHDWVYFITIIQRWYWRKSRSTAWILWQFVYLSLQLKKYPCS